MEENPDVFVALGDTIYSDSGLNDDFGIPDAYTVEQYRAKYRESLSVLGADLSHFPLQDLRRATSTIAIWDDHEVTNDYDGQTVDPVQYANGTQAFEEYWPVEPQRGGVAYRHLGWGRDVEIFVLDQRSFRSADVEAICGSDPAPTLSPGLRVSAGLPASPPPGCLAAINDPARTFLGAEQLAWFKDALARSRATWKLVISELGISQLLGVPYDRWEGYAAERADVINFIASRDIRNVVFLTTDLHMNMMVPVFLDKFSSSVVAGREFINGPVQTTTLLNQLVDLFGEAGAAGFINLLKGLVAPACAHLDQYSYGLVELDAATKNLTVSFKTATPAAGGGGTVVPNAFSDVAGSLPECSFTMAPS